MKDHQLWRRRQSFISALSTRMRQPGSQKRAKCFKFEVRFFTNGTNMGSKGINTGRGVLTREKLGFSSEINAQFDVFSRCPRSFPPKSQFRGRFLKKTTIPVCSG